MRALAGPYCASANSDVTDGASSIRASPSVFALGAMPFYNPACRIPAWNATSYAFFLPRAVRSAIFPIPGAHYGAPLRISPPLGVTAFCTSALIF